MNEQPRPADRHRRIGVYWKLFAYIALFTTFMLIVVWVFQIGLLNYFYRQSKFDELNTVEAALTASLESEQSSIGETVLACAEDYTVCIRVFRLNWVDGHGYASSMANSPDVSSDCLIHPMDETTLTHLYRGASENGGAYDLLISPGEHLTDFFPKDPFDPGRQHRFSRLSSGETLLRVRLLPVTAENGMDDVWMILINAELVPMSATVRTLKTQFWVIAAILFAGAVLLVVLMSRNISRPIQQMNEAAKKLATGDYDADFKVRGYLEVEELSDSLTRAAAELSQNDKLQKELIANISHDLRTPLTMITGYSEVMRDLPGENTPENVQVIIDETQRLTELVNDLLDLSKLQAGTRKLNIERFSLTDTVGSVMLRYGKLTEKDGYHIELSADGPVEVAADRTMILQVIYNLINNAVNYTGADKYVRVVQKRSDDGTRVRVSVTDTGEGIPADRIPLIWDRYYKVDKVHRRAMVGTGLGLSIVKWILEAHHATYGVESKLGEGSTFWFELPIVTDTVAADTADADGN
ncbi:MAG: HAMP domain-containing histidine kinase [Clostridia bacterium]|nr:HAMP domain-containing histidine kinase [Clostridia bacterium]